VALKSSERGFPNFLTCFMMRATVILFLFSLQSAAQQTDTAALIASAQGINTTDITFYEIEGYKVFTEEVKSKSDDKGLDKIRRRYSIKNNAVDTSNGGFVLTEVRDVEDSIRQSNVYFVSRVRDGKMQLIGFETALDRDKALEQIFYRAITDSTIPKKVMASQVIDTISFAGRTIQSGPACRWMQVRSVQCSGYGQFNWSEFRSEDRAKRMIQVSKKRNDMKKLGNVIEEKELDVLLEGEKTRAIKQRVKIRVPKIVMGGTNELIVYYVTAKVRGRFVACVLSYYSDEAKEGDLPPLLREVMQLVPPN
jgi:hypothetical protein